MYNQQRTGAFISQLRKKRNWTQLELADRLNVTHQAVSRWETGQSFPDIATLVQIGELFDVSVDDMLNGDTRPRPATQAQATLGEVLTDFARDRPEQVASMVRARHVSVDAVIIAGPLVPPTSMERFMTALDYYPLTNDEYAALAPFLGQDVLEELLARSGETPDPELFGAFAPFLSTESLGRVVERIAAGQLDRELLGHIAPFLNADMHRTLLSSVADENLSEMIDVLAPFLSRDLHNQLIDRIIAGSLDLEIAETLAPFLDQEALMRLLVADAQSERKLLIALAPFLAKDTLARLVLGSSSGQHTILLP